MSDQTNLTDAREIIRRYLSQVDPGKKYPLWEFFNHLFMATLPGAQLDSTQENLLEAMLSRVQCGIYQKAHNNILLDFVQRAFFWLRRHLLFGVPQNEFQSICFALQIATWINGVHAARLADSPMSIPMSTLITM